ncbi:MAG TPA: magnesium/cobalt transporter CorA [Ktedonobacterales bacterium]|nr:magnesium/cobalt transporter CorA [Ktedonobacterales bacterium]
MQKQVMQQVIHQKSVIHSRVLKDGQWLCDLPLDQLATYAADPEARMWVDLENVADPQIIEIGSWFGISRLTLEDLVEQNQRAKMEEGDGYYYLVMHSLEFDRAADRIATPELDIVFSERFLLTAHDVPLPCLTDLKNHESSETRPLKRGIDFLLHAITDALVDSYFPVLDELDDVLDELEDTVTSSPTPEVQRRIFTLKRGLAQMRRVVSPQVELFSRLGGRVYHIVSDEAAAYFRDVHDHLVRIFEVIDSYRDLMSGMLDAYLSTVSNRLNEVMKRLTIIATIFMPITFITGVFGQNFGFSPQVVRDNGYFFWYMLAFMGFVTILQLLWFRWKRWF